MSSWLSWFGNSMVDALLEFMKNSSSCVFEIESTAGLIPQNVAPNATNRWKKRRRCQWKSSDERGTCCCGHLVFVKPSESRRAQQKRDQQKVGESFGQVWTSAPFLIYKRSRGRLHRTKEILVKKWLNACQDVKLSKILCSDGDLRAQKIPGNWLSIARRTTRRQRIIPFSPMNRNCQKDK